MFTMYPKLTDLLACLGGSGDTAWFWDPRRQLPNRVTPTYAKGGA